MQTCALIVSILALGAAILSAVSARRSAKAAEDSARTAKMRLAMDNEAGDPAWEARFALDEVPQRHHLHVRLNNTGLLKAVDVHAKVTLILNGEDRWIGSQFLGTILPGDSAAVALGEYPELLLDAQRQYLAEVDGQHPNVADGPSQAVTPRHPIPLKASANIQLNWRTPAGRQGSASVVADQDWTKAI